MRQIAVIADYYFTIHDDAAEVSDVLPTADEGIGGYINAKTNRVMAQDKRDQLAQTEPHQARARAQW